MAASASASSWTKRLEALYLHHDPEANVAAVLRSQSEKGKTAEQVYQSAVVKYCYCGGKVTDEAWANKEAAFESWRSGQTICARGCTPALHNAFAAPLAEWASQLQVRAACWSREPPPTSKALCWSAREIAQLRDPYPRVVAYLARSCSPSTSPALTQCWRFRSAALNVRCSLVVCRAIFRKEGAPNPARPARRLHSSL